MPPPFPIYRGQGNQPYQIAKPGGPIQRGQTAIYEKNGAPTGGSVSWGAILGTLSAQTDLQAAIDAKLDDSQASAYGLTLLAAATTAAAKILLALAKADVGLGSVDNTADAAKNVLTATKLVTARNIAGNSFDGSANISINDTDLSGAAWTTYTPTLTPQAGAITASTAAGRYKRVGKTVFFVVKITITTVGTATGYLNVSLPFAAVNSGGHQAGIGVETGLTNSTAVTGTINNNLALMTVYKYDTTSILASGAVVQLSGHYEVT